MNNKGFTLVEVLAVLVLLGAVMTISVYSVVDYLSTSKEKSIDVFKENIKSGMINYYNECKYLSTGVGVCEDANFTNNNYTLSTTIGDLVKHGFLDSNTSSYGIKDPVTEEDISRCNISLKFENKKFGEVSYTGNCGSLNNG